MESGGPERSQLSKRQATETVDSGSVRMDSGMEGSRRYPLSMLRYQKMAKCASDHAAANKKKDTRRQYILS
jgi:hypothetical protein